DSFFNEKKIALIDPSEKNSNDKTWSFWETKPSQWDAIVHKSWHHATIKTSQKTIALNLEPYTYKTIRAIDFYNHAKTQLNQHKNIQFISETVENVEETSQVLVKTDKDIYTASHVFDSRIPEAFLKTSSKYTIIKQH